ncbi:ATP-binding cassette domain-containing protein [Anaerosalibacter bizertensis]|uniref:ATP-binding cassette domain-containing protein n=1 Tax=Anaerosalibacter bizertensis TaxID=932217 RepID=A0A9Q4ABM0_9FIRM|nr:ATP-binding cassette domain-containing protein [Anaerosalibacter bizertensis]MBV1816762.1 ATP-binding cassette domain-containing protein [Bacteroidales bacterium MSK.15.36]MCB5560392.1 ATP-binding cassette domain-containing protein [Anaerosalibacter bizertensis]MCG4564392.1 ATP-binding cassette domain-containing protein [Anaerosalibacter bizertensis]MCG4582508.1 ATP-binding cassette domain-containing protein [Anaerosalibacter bizertensis]MCG4586093.1 ATP-binding cassette domain-containing p
MIEVNSLSKHFKDVVAVDNISFKVEEGKVFGLLGENGAGKTTTLRMLATMLKPTTGTANIGGYDLIQEPVDVRGEIGILFGGETGLYDRLSARENIEYFGLLNGMTKEDINIQIEKLSHSLEMEDYIERRVGKFSKGMKQKVALARSIVHNPSIMFFDEPTSGLDVTAVRIVHKFIKELKSEGKTIIFSSHSMNEVEKLCDEVGIIHKGKMIEVSTLEGLKEKFKEENLEEIFISLVGEKNE